MLNASTVTLKPRDLGKFVEISETASEPPLATLTGSQLTAASGEPLLRLAIEKPGRMSGRRDNPADVALQVADAQGAPVGIAKIVKYGFGPRAKKLTLALSGPDGAEAGRVEPADDRGDRLVATVGGAQAASVEVEQVKIGFLRKARVYSVSFDAEPDALLLGALVGYEMLLSEATAAAMRD